MSCAARHTDSCRALIGSVPTVATSAASPVSTRSVDRVLPLMAKPAPSHLNVGSSSAEDTGDDDDDGTTDEEGIGVDDAMIDDDIPEEEITVDEIVEEEMGSEEIAEETPDEIPEEMTVEEEMAPREIVEDGMDEEEIAKEDNAEDGAAEEDTTDDNPEDADLGTGKLDDGLRPQGLADAPESVATTASPSCHLTIMRVMNGEKKKRMREGND